MGCSTIITTGSRSAGPCSRPKASRSSWAKAWLGRWFPALALFVAGWGAAQGAVVLSPVAVVDSSLAPYDANTPVENMINQSGITEPFVSGSTDFGAYFAVAGEPFGNANYVNNWQSELSFNLPLTGYIDFDLGESYTIDRISLKDVTIELYEELAEPGVMVGEFALTSNVNSAFSYRVELLTLNAPTRGRYLRLNILSTYTFSPSDTFGYAIVGELAVSATSSTAAPLLTIARTTDGQVQVTFTGTLQSAASPEGTFSDVPGNPTGTYLAPDLGSPRYFRAKVD
jgi:hypothetical protein